MTDAELQAIRGSLTVWSGKPPYEVAGIAWKLLVEVDRLRALFDKTWDDAVQEGFARMRAEAEVERLQAITTTVRRCPNCHAERIGGRDFEDVDNDAPSDEDIPLLEPDDTLTVSVGLPHPGEEVIWESKGGALRLTKREPTA